MSSLRRFISSAILLAVSGLATHASSVPWPTIPSPASYSSPAEAPFIEPVSVVKGLTSDSSSESRTPSMVFNHVNDIYTIDYGRVVAGKPRFIITSVTDFAQIEVRYSEAYIGLENSQGDGPFAFSNGLSATFRVETFNVTENGQFDGFFIQGSQRWQSIRLVRGTGLSIEKAGFVSTIDETPIEATAGYFASSNNSYTDIWNLGPRTERLCCFPPGSQSSTWELSDKGAYIRGQKPASTAHVVNAHNYTLSFETMIDFGGTGWRLDTEIDAIQATGPIFVLTSEYPEGTFANIDRDLVPPNTLVLGRGWSLQNQTSLPGFVLQKFPLNITVTEKQWHTIETTSHGDDTYTVLLDDQEIASFNISSYGVGNPNPYIPGGTSKSFAFGPWQDQAAWIRNVNLTLSSGETIYSNAMKSEDILAEYGVQINTEYVCSDAGKRDRYSWLGDRLISSRVTMVSTAEDEFVWGPAEQAISRQSTSGQVPINTLFSPLDTESILIRTTNVDPLIVDYNFDVIQVIYDYWLRSGNDTFIEKHWSQMIAINSYAISRSLDPETQLYGAPAGSLGLPLSGEKGQALGPANTVSLILGLERLAEMAEYLGHEHSAKAYRQQAVLTRDAVDRLLWNSTGGFYASTIGAPGYDLMDIAQVLLGKIGTQARRRAYTEKLAALRVPAGYMNGTRFEDTPQVVNPYYLSFLLEGLAKENQVELAQELLDSTWGPMVRRDANYTEAYWEYVSPDGVYPGLDLFTANSHFWGSYPTVFLTEYVLGIRPTAKAYSKFLFAPLPGFTTEWVQGRVPTPSGLVYAAWGYNDRGKIVMEVTAPSGLSCTIIPPFEGAFTANGKSTRERSVTVAGGQKVTVVQG
ncbi:catalytic activity: RhaA is able to hydrolyze alpha-1 [Dactylonectria estremocensis]|uniref:Catalytic activity: RhaA is able to hydrolyze alpha-1 n=1 Tax=Dactylonectria estremocensis TaxID=1079267 RepID=A0A9P9E374_9HYPO|nr:catalytic activity: RhaA is able to hydrolyze alpha-1 [Dactylonectria estremocensis]